MELYGRVGFSQACPDAAVQAPTRYAATPATECKPVSRSHFASDCCMSADERWCSSRADSAAALKRDAADAAQDYRQPRESVRR
jgi:hypothetical protein